MFSSIFNYKLNRRLKKVKKFYKKVKKFYKKVKKFYKGIRYLVNIIIFYLGFKF